MTWEEKRHISHAAAFQADVVSGTGANESIRIAVGRSAWDMTASAADPATTR